MRPTITPSRRTSELDDPRLERVADPGRVHGAPGVYAPGDCTDFPVKHASLAAQQADAVASAIAMAAGLADEPVQFEPVLRSMPSRLRWYVDAPITGGYGEAARMSPRPLWPPIRLTAR